MISRKKFDTLNFETRLRKIFRWVFELESETLTLLMKESSGEFHVDFSPGFREKLDLLEYWLIRDVPVSDVLSSSPPVSRAATAACGKSIAIAERHRALNDLRHAIASILGEESAEWDLLQRPRDSESRPGNLKKCAIYCESIRSPFNLGSIFRTACAFGVGELILSPSCPSPSHPRAERSAMGCVERQPWRVSDNPQIADCPIFALELGGTPIEEFNFPRNACVVVGSEELGVHPETLERCRDSAGVVTIPLYGPKASLNVAVSLGILLHAWQSSRRIMID